MKDEKWLMNHQMVDVSQKNRRKMKNDKVATSLVE